MIPATLRPKINIIEGVNYQQISAAESDETFWKVIAVSSRLSRGKALLQGARGAAHDANPPRISMLKRDSGHYDLLLPQRCYLNCGVKVAHSQDPLKRNFKEIFEIQ